MIWVALAAVAVMLLVVISGKASRSEHLQLWDSHSKTARQFDGVGSRLDSAEQRLKELAGWVDLIRAADAHPKPDLTAELEKLADGTRKQIAELRMDTAKIVERWEKSLDALSATVSELNAAHVPQAKAKRKGTH